MTENWIKKYTEYVNPKVEFRIGKYGLSAFAKEAIPDMEPLIIVSHKDILTEPYSLSTPLGKLVVAEFGENHKMITPRIIMYVVMIYERFDKNAHFHEYIKSLPVIYDDPFWWTEEELQYLRSSKLSKSVDVRLKYFKKIYNTLLPFFVRNSVTYPPDVFTWEAFLWAHSSFSSRGFPHILSTDPSTDEVNPIIIEEPVYDFTGDINPFQLTWSSPVGCMVPVLDILNHAVGRKINWDRNATSVTFASKAMKGEEIFNNYGPKSNEELLLSFGFVIPDNPCDAVTLSLSYGSPGQTLHRISELLNLPKYVVLQRSTFFRRSSISSSPPDDINSLHQDVQAKMNEIVPDELIGVARLLVMDPLSQVALLKQIEDAVQSLHTTVEPQLDSTDHSKGRVLDVLSNSESLTNTFTESIRSRLLGRHYLSVFNEERALLMLRDLLSSRARAHFVPTSEFSEDSGSRRERDIYSSVALPGTAACDPINEEVSISASAPSSIDSTLQTDSVVKKRQREFGLDDADFHYEEDSVALHRRLRKAMAEEYLTGQSRIFTVAASAIEKRLRDLFVDTASSFTPPDSMLQFPLVDLALHNRPSDSAVNLYSDLSDLGGFQSRPTHRAINIAKLSEVVFATAGRFDEINDFAAAIGVDVGGENDDLSDGAEINASVEDENTDHPQVSLHDSYLILALTLTCLQLNLNLDKGTLDKDGSSKRKSKKAEVDDTTQLSGDLLSLLEPMIHSPAFSMSLKQWDKAVNDCLHRVSLSSNDSNSPSSKIKAIFSSADLSSPNRSVGEDKEIQYPQQGELMSVQGSLFKEVCRPILTSSTAQLWLRACRAMDMHAVPLPLPSFLLQNSHPDLSNNVTTQLCLFPGCEQVNYARGSDEVEELISSALKRISLIVSGNGEIASHPLENSENNTTNDIVWARWALLEENVCILVPLRLESILWNSIKASPQYTSGEPVDASTLVQQILALVRFHPHHLSISRDRLSTTHSLHTTQQESIGNLPPTTWGGGVLQSSNGYEVSFGNEWLSGGRKACLGDGPEGGVSIHSRWLGPSMSVQAQDGAVQAALRFLI